MQGRYSYEFRRPPGQMETRQEHYTIAQFNRLYRVTYKPENDSQVGECWLVSPYARIQLWPDSRRFSPVMMIMFVGIAVK